MDSINDIGVFVSGSSNLKALLDGAGQFAARHDAHVTGYYVISPPPDISSFTEFGGIVPQDVVDRHYDNARALADEARAAFEKSMDDHNVLRTFQVDEGYALKLAPGQFRYTDVAIVGQVDPDAAESQRPLINTILMATGRPLMVMPNTRAPDVIGERVIVGWNRSKEAARSIHDALPLLRLADAVEILDIEEHNNREVLGSSVSMTQHLARHDITATATSIPRTDTSAGDVILNYAAETNTDLIVAGAWGHTRATEYLFGGVTRTLIEDATIPVWLSH